MHLGSCRRHWVKIDLVQGIHSGSGGQELWSKGHRWLFGWQFQSLLVDTRGEGGCEAEEGGFPGLLGSGVCRSRWQVLFWFSEIAKKLSSGKGPGVDIIHPDTLKDLDFVELTWLTCLLQWLWSGRLGSGSHFEKQRLEGMLKLL